jgi:anti-sigma-K factor RskA
MDINSYISSGIIEMYVMDLCTPEERQETDRLRKQYPELNQAIEEFEKKLESNLLSQAVLPGEETDTKILASLRLLQLQDKHEKSSPGKVRSINRFKLIAAAAVVLLIISGIFNYIMFTRLNEEQALIKQEKQSPLPLSDYKILQEPSITPVAMYGVAPYTLCRCTMFWDKKTGKAYIMIHHLPLSSETESFQLWAMVDGKPQSVGIINDKIRDRFIEMENVPQEAIAFTVTLEKKGGASTPTVKETYLSGKI